MLAKYEDIREKIKEEPQWYDENGTPRYAKFHPDLSPDIYANEVILLEITCQDCGELFFVEMDYNVNVKIFDRHLESFSNRLRKWLKEEKKSWCPVHYGDPPIHDCVGDTMNCNDIRIIEFWKRNMSGWKRIKKFEIKLEEPNK